MKKPLHPSKNLTLEDLARILADIKILAEAYSREVLRQSKEDLISNTEFDSDPTASVNVNMLEWRGNEKSLRSFWAFNEIHGWLIADNETHFTNHLTEKLTPQKKLIVGTRINDVIHIFKKLHDKRLLSFYDTLQHVLADHCIDQKEQELDPSGSLKSAVHKTPIIGSAKRAKFLDDIIDQILKDNGT